jgi:MoaA/NifB/PqqE/SkfB family radical SAM enzyme
MKRDHEQKTGRSAFSGFPKWFGLLLSDPHRRPYFERLMRKTFNMVRVLTNPRVMGPPLRVLRQVRRRGAGQISDDDGRGRKSTLRQRIAALGHLRRWLVGEKLTRHRGQWVINSFLPPFPGRAYERSWTNLFNDKRLSPLSAFLALTSKCPADCWYCSIKNRRTGPPLSTEQWLDVVAQLHQLGISLIAFTGGEPLTRSDLPDLVRAAHDGGAEVELFTSGIGLTQEKLDALRDASLWAIGVGLDSSEPEAVNRACGTDKAFDAAVTALDMSQRAGFYTFINAVADRDMVESGQYKRLYDLARRLKIHELRLLEPIGCGRLAVAGHDCFLSSNHIDELRRFHRETNRFVRGPKVCAFSQIEGPQVFGCAAGTQHLFVDPSGEVCPCDLTPLSFGNVLTESLDAIWHRMNSAMGLPRSICFMKTSAERIGRHAEGQSFPLPPETSCKIAEETPSEPMPDHFGIFMKPFGFGKPGQETSE